MSFCYDSLKWKWIMRSKFFLSLWIVFCPEPCFPVFLVGKWSLYQNQRTCTHEQIPLSQLLETSSVTDMLTITDSLRCLQTCERESSCGSTSLSVTGPSDGLCALIDKRIYACDEDFGVYIKVESSHCGNGGTWINKTNCNCPAGWGGPFCDYDNPDECSSNPCNDGECGDYIGGYSCSCYNGFSGTHCEENIDECVSSPCGPYGTCVDGDDGYTCSCCCGYSGSHCDEDINECGSNPCGPYGSCTDNVNGYTCVCTGGYSGTHCDISDPMEDWVSSVIGFSTQYSTYGWSADQVIGEPNVYPSYGDLLGTWAQSTFTANEYIEVQFPRSMQVLAIDIYETYHAGAVKRIQVKDPSTQQWVTVYTNSSPQNIAQSRIFQPTLTATSFATNQVRLELDCTVANSYCEIDAIKIRNTL